MTEKIKLTLDVVSDIMCPWCYIGKRRLAKAVSIASEIDIEIRWRPFQLDATLPEDGKDYRQYHEDKFGSPQKVDELRARMTEAGLAEGVPFAFDKVARAPNTLNVHRLIRWAGPVGVQNELVDRLFSLLFVEGADLTQISVLASAAAEVGMDFDRATELLASDQDRETVREEIELAHRMGVTSVPCFIIENKYAVLGAQDPAIIAQALRQAAGEKAEDAQFGKAAAPSA